MTFKMSLDSMFTYGAFNGMTLRDVINDDVSTVNNLKTIGAIKLDVDALCYLINKRSEKECAFGRRAQRMEERND